MNPDLFPIPESKPPLLDSLRRAYDKALRDQQEVQDALDQMGGGHDAESVHNVIRAGRLLMEEEARLASIK